MENTEVADYKLIREIEVVDFEKAIKIALADGWVLFGKLEIFPYDGFTTNHGYSRELVKYK